MKKSSSGNVWCNKEITYLKLYILRLQLYDLHEGPSVAPNL